jgi:glycolate oxidase iron-sulfur subunit
VHTATGCTAQLREYPELLANNEQTQAFKAKVHDINSFLAAHVQQHGWPQQLTLKPLPQTVLIHEPCSQRNVLRESGKVKQLLSLIPQISLQALPANLGCCGAGGGYMLAQADFSRRMRQKTLDAVSAAGHENSLLVTTNVGCALNLAAGLRELGQDIEVLHPVTLLHRQLA